MELDIEGRLKGRVHGIVKTLEGRSGLLVFGRHPKLTKGKRASLRAEHGQRSRSEIDWFREVEGECFEGARGYRLYRVITIFPV